MRRNRILLLVITLATLVAVIGFIVPMTIERSRLNQATAEWKSRGHWVSTQEGTPLELEVRVQKDAELDSTDIEILRILAPRIDLFNAEDSKMSDESLIALKDAHRLKTAWLTRTPVTGDGLRYLKNCRRLTRLRLTGCTVRDDDLKFVAELESLQVLSLIETQVTTRGLIQLRSLPNLYDLSLGRCENVDASVLPEVLIKFPAIRHVGLYNIPNETKQQLRDAIPGIDWIFNADDDFEAQTPVAK